MSKNITLKQIVEGILTNTNRNFTFLKSDKGAVNFKVKCENVNLFGKVTKDSYSMNIKKSDGEIIDRLTCGISHTDDIFNRINESIITGEKLSKYVTAVTDAKKAYLTPGIVTEDKDKDEDEDDDKEILLSDNEEEIIDNKEINLEDSLNDIIDNTLVMASETSDLIDYVAGTDDDVENKSSLVSILGAMYALADDVQTLIDDIYPEEEIDESVKSKHNKIKRNIKKEALSKLAEADLILRKEKDCKDIREAIKLVKSSLILK
jgi:hypothetical protein